MSEARGPWLIAAGFIAAGILAIRADVFLSNEGIFTWIFAGLTWESPREMLFYLKSRPPISLMYAPVAVFGLEAFLWAHVVVAALTIPLTAALARRFGHERPSVPAAFVALSPLFFAGSASGVQNTDGVVAMVLAVWLFVRGSHAAAGALMTFAVIGRVELVFFMVPLAAYSWREGSHRRFLGTALAVAAAYVAIGAAYHGTPLWPLRYPSSPAADPTVSEVARARYGGNVNDVVYSILALTPAIATVLWTSFRNCRALETLLGLTAVAYLVTIRIVPFTGLVYVDDSPRYVLPALPFVCLMLSRALERPKDWRTFSLRAAALLLLVPLIPGLHDPAKLLLVAAVAAGAVAAATNSRRVAVATLVAVVVATAGALLPTTHLYLGDQARMFDECIRWIAEQRPSKNAVVVTDIHLLAIWRDRHAPEVDADIRHVVTPDMSSQASLLANPATRQFEKVFGTARYFYAPWIFPEDIASLPGDVYFVMRTDIADRTGMLASPPFDHAKWLVRKEWLGGRLAHANGNEQADDDDGDHPPR